MKPTGPKVFWPDLEFVFHLFRNSGAGSLGYFEANRILCVALQYRSPFRDLTRCHETGHLHLLQSAAAELTVDCRVEECNIAMVFAMLKASLYRFDMFCFKSAFLTYNTPFVPSWSKSGARPMADL